MEKVLVLLATLAAGTHAFLPAADVKCDATQGTASCSVSSGGSVYIQVMANASGLVVRCKKNTTSGLTNVFSLRMEQLKMHKDNAAFFVSNGTLKITDFTKSDTGQYIFDRFNNNGVDMGVITVHLEIKDTFPFLILIVVIACAVVVLIVILSVVCIRRKKSASSKQTPSYEF